MKGTSKIHNLKNIMLPCIDVKTEAITENNTLNFKYRPFLYCPHIFKQITELSSHKIHFFKLYFYYFPIQNFVLTPLVKTFRNYSRPSWSSRTREFTFGVFSTWTSTGRRVNKHNVAGAFAVTKDNKHSCKIQMIYYDTKQHKNKFI